MFMIGNYHPVPARARMKRRGTDTIVSPSIPDPERAAVSRVRKKLPCNTRISFFSYTDPGRSKADTECLYRVLW